MPAATFAPRVFSGIQPSGNLTLGNYLGALRRFAAMQSSHETLYCIVDLHAITVWQDPAKLRAATRELAAAYIASGIDPERSILFAQSQVPGHAQLAWVFNCVARIGWMYRMIQFKDKAGKNTENASLGLLAYPALMAADILLYHATHVPVGEDQKQHIELTRDIAAKFNHDYGVDFFPLTEPVIEGTATRVMSLRDGTKKMSKSDPSDMSRINLTDDADTIAGKIRKARTDPEPLPATVAGLAGRPEAANLVNIYAALTDIDRRGGDRRVRRPAVLGVQAPPRRPRRRAARPDHRPDGRADRRSRRDRPPARPRRRARRRPSPARSSTAPTTSSAWPAPAADGQSSAASRGHRVFSRKTSPSSCRNTSTRGIAIGSMPRTKRRAARPKPAR